MSRPHDDVATSLSSAQLFFRSRPQFHVATDFFLFNSFSGRDIKVISRPPFLLLSSSLGRDLLVATSFLLIDFLKGCKLSSLASASILLQVVASFDTVFGCTLNTVIFMSRPQVDVVT